MSTAASPLNPVPTLSFQLKSSPLSYKFLPRLGQLTLTRLVHGHGAQDNGTINIELLTPGLMTSTTRGIIQHLSRDNVKRTSCVNWVHVPFESFLQIDPPIPTQQNSSYPLHTSLGFSPSHHVLSLSLRDAADGREMPPNGRSFIAAQSSRGARRVTCPAYRSYVTDTLPDIVIAMSDVPFTSPPYSQKRISKSIERSAQWLSTILTPLKLSSTRGVQNLHATASAFQSLSPFLVPRFNVFVHMVGDIKPAARSAFAAALLHPLESKEKDLLQLKTLDEGVSGYVFDLVPLRAALRAEQAKIMEINHLSHPSSFSDGFAPLIRASLEDLPVTKPRIVNTACSPHEMLKLIRDVGVDLFDTYWAQQAATWGVALDFRFPVPLDEDQQQTVSRKTRKRQIGHSLYEERFAHEFTSLADSYLDELEFPQRGHDTSGSWQNGGPSAQYGLCSCAACSPTWSNQPLRYSTVDDTGSATKEPASSYTRAYMHHLLHTHEMSAHALLVMHNLTVMDAFMSGVRAVLEQERGLGLNGTEPHVNEVKADQTRSNRDNLSLFAIEVTRFERAYDERLQVLDEARASWAEVDLARGKGRLARERERVKTLGDVMDTPIDNITADL